LTPVPNDHPLEPNAAVTEIADETEMPLPSGVFPDYPAPVVRNVGDDRELTMMRWGMPPPPRTAACRSRISETHHRHTGAAD
jgi:putative SOS response-associated peptidase YedK